eukprot:4657281-Alexandrium_andersonii.AAC.1
MPRTTAARPRIHGVTVTTLPMASAARPGRADSAVSKSSISAVSINISMRPMSILTNSSFSSFSFSAS